MNLFRAQGIKTLDRALFSRTLPTAAARVADNRLISKYRKELERTREVLQLDRFDPIADVGSGRKCLILKPGLDPSSPDTWSPVLREASKMGDLHVIPHQVTIGYDMWNYLDVMRCILPEDLHGEIPVGFNTAGHVAHLNLRDQYLPYKHTIAQVMVDKNPNIRTVINKVDNVGTESEFRTFAYEVLAGPDDMLVEVSEAGCVFKFDYSQVYWNTRLGTEHQRICALFNPGEVVVDVMAGIGPFAVPAGKKGVFVWANDKNPQSFKYLGDTIKRNKVADFVRPFNQDGHDFIRQAARLVLEASQRRDSAAAKPAVKLSRRTSADKRPAPVRIPVPPTISHFVMNLPASALEFLHNFKGLYRGRETLFTPHTDTRLPLVHVHCFAVKADDGSPLEDICRRIHDEIGVWLTPGDAQQESQVGIHEVRDVAPAKRMFCASFRLPPEVAFASHA